MLMGMALGVKFQAGAYAIALMPIVGIIGVERGNIRKAFASMTRFGLLCFVSAAPWLLKNLILFGAPFYPLFVPHRIEPWLVSLLPAGTTSLALDPRVWHIQQSARTAFNLRDAFVHPGALSVGGEGAFYFLNPILVLLPLGVLWIRNPRLVALAGPALLYGAIVLAVSPETNTRYLIPGHRGTDDHLQLHLARGYVEVAGHCSPGHSEPWRCSYPWSQRRDRCSFGLEAPTHFRI